MKYVKFDTRTNIYIYIYIYIDRIANTASDHQIDDVCNRVTMLNELLQCRYGMLYLSDDSFSSNDVEQLNFSSMHQLMTLPHYLSFLFFSLFWVTIWMWIDTTCKRDMYQVHEIKDDFFISLSLSLSLSQYIIEVNELCHVCVGVLIQT